VVGWACTATVVCVCVVEPRSWIVHVFTHAVRLRSACAPYVTFLGQQSATPSPRIFSRRVFGAILSVQNSRFFCRACIAWRANCLQHLPYAHCRDVFRGESRCQISRILSSAHRTRCSTNCECTFTLCDARCSTIALESRCNSLVGLCPVKS
jgi:hypothetical protein